MPDDLRTRLTALAEEIEGFYASAADLETYTKGALRQAIYLASSGIREALAATDPAPDEALRPEVERGAECYHGTPRACDSLRCGSNCGNRFDRMHPCPACLIAELHDVRAHVKELGGDPYRRPTPPTVAPSDLPVATGDAASEGAWGRFCAECQRWGDHHTDRHPAPVDADDGNNDCTCGCGETYLAPVHADDTDAGKFVHDDGYRICEWSDGKWIVRRPGIADRGIPGDRCIFHPTTTKETSMTTNTATLIRLTDVERESIRQRVILNWIWETDATTADDQQDIADWMASEFEVLLTARAAACVGCGEAHDDGPTDSDGKVWCGECATEARQQNGAGNG